MRIILITAFTLIASGILLLTARIWGLSQPHPIYNHPFLSDTKPLIILKVGDLVSAEDAVKIHPSLVLWLDVRFSKDKIPFVLPPLKDVEFLNSKRKDQEQNPSVPIMTGGKISEYDFEKIKSFFPQISKLEDFYSKFPTGKFILNIVDNVADAHLVLTESLKGHKPNERTLVQSDTLILMTSVKELKPEWIFGTSIPDLVRFLTFDSMWILPTTQFKGDVFIAPFKIGKRAAYNDNVIAEMRRRNKKVILGPIENQNELNEALRLQADGYVTTNLTDLLSRLNLGPAQ